MDKRHGYYDNEDDGEKDDHRNDNYYEGEGGEKGENFEENGHYRKGYISIKSTRISMTRIMILTSTNAMAVDITTKVVTIVMNKSRIMVRDVITKKSIIIEIVRIAVTPRITRIIITRIIVMAKKTFVAMETNGNIEYQISSFFYCYFS